MYKQVQLDPTEGFILGILQPYLQEQLLHIHPSAPCCSATDYEVASPPPPPSLPHTGGLRHPASGCDLISPAVLSSGRGSPEA